MFPRQALSSTSDNRKELRLIWYISCKNRAKNYTVWSVWAVALRRGITTYNTDPGGPLFYMHLTSKFPEFRLLLFPKVLQISIVSWSFHMFSRLLSGHYICFLGFPYWNSKRIPTSFKKDQNLSELSWKKFSQFPELSLSKNLEICGCRKSKTFKKFLNPKFGRYSRRNGSFRFPGLNTTTTHNTCWSDQLEIPRWKRGLKPMNLCRVGMHTGKTACCFFTLF